jgi:hypothetical protein
MSNAGSPPPSGTSLAELVDHAGGRRAAAAAVLDELVALAENLELAENAERLRAVRHGLDSDTFEIIVLGGFSSGKSTLLNALLADTTSPVELAGQHGPMAVNDLPATAVLTSIRYTSKPTVTAWRHDGSRTTWPLERYLTESARDIDEEANQRRFGQIREIELGYPARLCMAGVTLYDSPGLDDAPMRTAITRAAIRRCDAAVLVTRSDMPLGMSELEAVRDLSKDGTQLFVVVNLFGARPSDDLLQRFLWNRLVRDHRGGPAWAGQDLATCDMYLVDAKRAADARRDHDEAEASGLGAFERRLGHFLLHERARVRVARHAVLADHLAGDIERHLSARMHALRIDSAGLPSRHGKVREHLATLRHHPERIPVLFERYRRAAELELVDSFRRMVDQIRQDLPGHLEAVQLPAERTVLGGALLQKRLLREASEEISHFASDRIQSWGAATAPELLSPMLEELGTKIEDEVTEIARLLDEIRAEAGDNLRDAAGDPGRPRTRERVLAAVASSLDSSVAVDVRAGLRGTVSSAGPLIGVATALGALSVVSGAALLPGALVIGLAAAGAYAVNSGRRAKARAYLDADEPLSRLPDEMAPVIRERLAARLAEMQEAITTAVTTLIAEEERQVAQLERLSHQARAEREEALNRLDAATRSLAEYRQQLRAAVGGSGPPAPVWDAGPLGPIAAST